MLPPPNMPADARAHVRNSLIGRASNLLLTFTCDLSALWSPLEAYLKESPCVLNLVVLWLFHAFALRFLCLPLGLEW